jgi:hypothetical protein
MIFQPSYFYACLSLLLIGCATDSKEDKKAEPAPPQSLAQRLSEGGGFVQDKDGSWVPKSNKRSSFELQSESPYFKGEIKKKAYQAGDYEKKSWWGKKTYEKSEYKGDTDGSRFMIEAQPHGKKNLYADKRVPTGDPYKTNVLEYGKATESDAERLDKPRNDYAESRRRKFVQPSIIEWEEQRKLSLEESRGILGR